MISPEEVTAEVVAALRERDSTRFEQLLLTKDELKSIGLGSDQTKDLSTRITAAAGGFRDLARKQQSVGPKSEWIHFGASRPGVVPSGTEGSTQDLIVYDNVAAVIETDGKHAQVSVGTLIRVGDNWRVIDLPKNLLAEDAGTVPTGFFFNASFVRPSGAEAIPDAGFSETVQKLIAEYERVDRELGSARGAQLTQLNARRAELLEQLADATSDGAERTNWIRQYADTISAAVQSDAFPDGVNRLKAYYEKLAKTPRDSDLAAYVKFRYLTAEYGQSLQQKDADFAKIQSHWMENLEAFVKEFPRGQDTAEAMLQLALGQEFAGNESDAKNWYRRIVSDFPSTQLATKAAGATRRLDSIGQTIELRGKTTDGRTLDLATYRGKTVLIHYWATWCEPCKEEFTILKQMQAKYAKQGLEVIGVSLDSDAQTLATYLRSNRLAWPQLYEDGGLDSRLANELGILTLPTMILVDSKGKVISRNIHAGELDAELGKQFR
jgi:thiol-disulfide isomerase/thioredoxin